MNKYGLLGEHLSHSYSKIIHEYLFKENNIDAQYELIEIKEEDLPTYIDYLKKGIYKGFNVTIPYKEKVIPFLDELSDAAKKIKAVNTIYLKDGLVIGDNTDYIGFKMELEYYNINLSNKNCYVLGTGGASKAITYALEELGAKVFLCSRDNKKGISYDELKNIIHYDALINTTPLGMYPNINNSILEEEFVKRSDVAIDLIFNPRITKFLSYSDNGYNGLLMLIFQAVAAENFWNKNIKYDLKKLLEVI